MVLLSRQLDEQTEPDQLVKAHILPEDVTK